MSTRRASDIPQWLLVAVAVGLAPWLLSVRGSPPVIEVALTLVTADKHDLSCALQAPPRGYRCGYAKPGVATQGDQAAPVLQPFVSLDRQIFLIPGLFAERNVARRYLGEPPQGHPRGRLRRFIARCRLRLVAQVTSAWVRFGPEAVWGPAQPLLVADVLSCRVEG